MLAGHQPQRYATAILAVAALSQSLMLLCVAAVCLVAALVLWGLWLPATVDLSGQHHDGVSI